MKTLYETFNAKLKNLHESENLDFLTHSKQKKRSLNFIGDALNYCCGVATDHNLNRLVSSDRKVEEQILEINRGLCHTLRSIPQESQKFMMFENQTIINFKKLGSKTKQKKH